MVYVVFMIINDYFYVVHLTYLLHSFYLEWLFNAGCITAKYPHSVCYGTKIHSRTI